MRAAGQSGDSLAVALLTALLASSLLVGCGNDEELAEITLTAEAGGARARVWVPINEPRSTGTFRAEVDWGGGVTDRVESDRDGMLVGAWLEDLTGDDDPELIVVTASSGSGTYGVAHVYSRRNDALNALELAGLSAEQREGYMGHDVFTVEAGMLAREFPVYLSEDINAEPSGGTARYVYDFDHNVWLSAMSP